VRTPKPIGAIAIKALTDPLLKSWHTEPAEAGAAPDRADGAESKGLHPQTYAHHVCFHFQSLPPLQRQFSNIFSHFGKAATCGLELGQSAQEPSTEKHMHPRIYPHTRTRIYSCISTPELQHFLQKAMASASEGEQGAQVLNTERHMRLRLYPHTHARTHLCTHKHTTTQVTMSKRQLPPRTMAFASTTKGVCFHNKRSLTTQPNRSTRALKGTCPHNQRHWPPQCKAFASTIHALEGQRQFPPRTLAFDSTTKGIRLHHK